MQICHVNALYSILRILILRLNALQLDLNHVQQGPFNALSAFVCHL